MKHIVINNSISIQEAEVSKILFSGEEGMVYFTVPNIYEFIMNCSEGFGFDTCVDMCIKIAMNYVNFTVDGKYTKIEILWPS